jgi:heme/copper-type cytochrome/quinol oxidase subunit 3
MTLQEVRLRKKNSKKTLRYFWTTIALGNIIFLVMLAIIFYNL